MSRRAVRRTALLLALATALGACSAQQRTAPLPLDHPAHPRAAAAEPGGAADVFALTPTFALPGVGAGPGAAMSHAAGMHPGSAAPSGAEHQHPLTYTCPMHPEVQEDAPGTCPICGMTLRPAAVQEH